MKTSIKTRFCPSPTGLVHLGNIRTALFNALLARHHHGTFLLRIEDTDRERSKEEYVNAQKEDLRWLDLSWQEGPEVGGDRGPYYQSERQVIYDQYYAQLEQAGLAYPCFCTEEQLSISRKIQRSQGKPPRYAGTCRHLTKAQIEEKLEQGLKATLRFMVNDDVVITFQDLVKGEQTFYGRDIGDFIIRRTDGTPPFMFCNALDDALMGVTHVLRGDDHLTNTPRQIMILQALELPVPQYAHMALIVGPDGSPLSKRHGSRHIQELRQEGFLSVAINNYLARLGHHYADEGKLMTLDELAVSFNIESLGSAPARFDESQLLHWQKIAVLRLTHDEFWRWLPQSLRELIPKDEKKIFLETVKPNVVFPGDAKRWVDIFYGEELDYSNEQQQLLKTAGSEFFNICIETLDQQGPDFFAISQAIKASLNIKGKALFMTLRIALTALDHGPELAHIFPLLGKGKLQKRFEQAKAFTEN